ncbi:hypothetical protein EV586_101869 [Tumebacillus sp. BK434]|uniref:hypothetical protein n=1 Tax=Tumebacillus sp. BK434 TaxID=2512169 RepID=UPI001047029D|nr:hypothetical protein [Tumebacillus sp. BK434]TCP59637.1 hypothetical protein EV586_101869 [Tumebacillus sp. BK434]
MKKWLRITTALFWLLLLTVSATPEGSAGGVQDKPGAAEQTTAELTKFRGQLGAIKQKEHNIRHLNHQMRDNSYELRKLLHQTDKVFQADVEKKLQSFRANLKQAYVLHKQGEAVKKKIHAARKQRDLSQLRALMGELDSIKSRQLEHLRLADQELESELARVKERVRSRERKNLPAK